MTQTRNAFLSHPTSTASYPSTHAEHADERDSLDNALEAEFGTAARDAQRATRVQAALLRRSLTTLYALGNLEAMRADTYNPRTLIPDIVPDILPGFASNWPQGLYNGTRGGGS